VEKSSEAIQQTSEVGNPHSTVMKAVERCIGQQGSPQVYLAMIPINNQFDEVANRARNFQKRGDNHV